ncbi:TauD/TfdA family dioxygenase [Actinokineospora inagensis]|uniref:TauD/TfdA family dioxygenase n=1 Tax=Actinokineospora inagensis TaxID=103730 RepID=UPI0009FE0CD2|nr:TauD/TfdA family dioxygenase [Actinokineospora inagensis]
MVRVANEKFAKLGSGGDRSQLAELVTRTHYNSEEIPLAFEADRDVDLPSWVAGHRDALRAGLHDRGAVLLRSPGRPSFEAVVDAFTEALVDYRGGAAIRSRTNDTTYTASEYPNELEIRQHSEFCYSHDWPMLLFFHCATAPGDRGQTPLTDNRKVLREIPAEIRAEFIRRGLLYVRGYGYNRTWQRSYETDSRQEVEALCAAEGRRAEWVGDDQLRTYETRPATARHPVTGEEVWFNYAHGFHISRMDDGIRDVLSTSPEDTDEQLWPNNVFWADGGEIDPEIINVVNDIVASCTTQFDWQEGDTLIVDNMLCAHGRRPYTGPRRILLKMAESYAEIAAENR